MTEQEFQRRLAAIPSYTRVISERYPTWSELMAERAEGELKAGRAALAEQEARLAELEAKLTGGRG